MWKHNLDKQKILFFYRSLPQGHIFVTPSIALSPYLFKRLCHMGSAQIHALKTMCPTKIQQHIRYDFLFFWTLDKYCNHPTNN